MSLVKSAKITEIGEVKPYTNSFGTTLYHNLTLDNGDKINIGKKAECRIGWEITYTLDDSDDGQQEFRKAKSAAKVEGNQSNPPVFNNSGVVKSGYNDNLKGVKVGHAVTNAVTLVASQGTNGKDLKESIKEYAQMIYLISEELNTEL